MKAMRVWLVTVGEPLPCDEGSPRLLRCGILASMLADRECDVTWWSSNFNHAKKENRTAGFSEITLRPNYRLRLLSGRPYKKNISLHRILNHKEIAADFRNRIRDEQPPDIIVCSYPTIELCDEALKYAKLNHIPTIIDIRDLWPDTFLDILPKFFRPIGKIVLASAFQKKRRVLSDATSLVAINPAFLKWAEETAARIASPFDMVFPLGYERPKLDSNEARQAEVFWSKYNLLGRGQFQICFFGNLAEHVLDLDTVINAAELLQSQAPHVQFIICGNGAAYDRLRAKSKGMSNIFFTGWIDAPKIRFLMKHAHAGLVPYESRWDFVSSMPNKSIEYMSAGLPLISCLQGALQDYLAHNRCGVQYKERDVESLVHSILALVNNPAYRNSLAKNAQRQYDIDFDANVVYSRYISHMSMLCMHAE